MDFEFSAEQQQLKEQARRYLADKCPTTAVRAILEGSEPFDRALWQGLGEMGFLGAAIPEEYGGLGLGYLELCVIAEELGRALAPVPVSSSIFLVAEILKAAGSEEQKQKWLPKLASGEAIGTLAIDEGPRHNPAAIATTASKSGDGWTLSGTKAFVHEAHGAALFIVAAQTPDGVGVFAVPADAAGLSLATRKLTDSRSHAHVTLANVKVGADAYLGGSDLLDRLLDRARIVTAAEMLGLAEHSFGVTLDYLKQRVQFGQILATFQALQHRMAELFTRIELMRTDVEAALAALDSSTDVPAMASLAKATANDTLHLVSREAIQLHGGIGMTDEFDIGLYMKRARAAQETFGDIAFNGDRLAKLMGY